MVGRTDLGCRSCCTACVYESSDGNIYADDFSGSLDADWECVDTDPFGVNDTPQITSGKLEAISNGVNGVLKYIWHTTDDGVYAYSGLRIILEADVYEVTRSQSQGVAVTLSVFKTFVVGVDWIDGSFYLSEQNVGSPVSLNQTPVDGDKLTIIVEHISGVQWRVCGYVNEENFGEILTEWDPGQPNVIVLPHLPYSHENGSAGDKLVSFDNYTLHIGNP